MQKVLFAALTVLAVSNVTGTQAAMRIATPLPPARPVAILADAPMQQAGTLTCMLQSGVGFVVGSSRTATCVFDHPGENSYSQTYEANLSRIGLDVGVMPKQAMRWAVMTPGGVAEPGMLQGAHPGSSAEAAVAVGNGAKVSFQDSDRKIAFQQMNSPMTFGVSFSLGEANLELAAPAEAVYN